LQFQGHTALPVALGGDDRADWCDVDVILHNG